LWKNQRAFKNLNVYSEYEVTGINLDSLINKLIKKGIEVKNIKKLSPKCIRFSIKLCCIENFFAIMKDLCYTNIVKVKDYGKGYPLLLSLKNYGVILGCVFLFAFAFYFNGFILKVNYSGTGAVLKNDIDMFLVEKGIVPFCRIDNNRVKLLSDEILAFSDKLSFAEVKKQGNHLNIEVVLADNNAKTIAHQDFLACDCDGVLSSINIYRGTALKSVGDSVKKGDIIVAGYQMVGETVVPLKVIATVVIDIQKQYEFISENDNEEDLAVVFAKNFFCEDAVLNKIDKNILENGKYQYVVYLTISKIIQIWCLYIGDFMEQKGSLKLLPWSKSDIVKVVLVYLFNLVVIIGLFLLGVFAVSQNGGTTFSEFFSEYSRFINFIVIAIMLFIVTAVFLVFEYRNFLHTPANSEMLFLIIETGLVIDYICSAYLSSYLRPIVFVTITTLFLTDKRIAIFIDFLFSIFVLLFDSFVGLLDAYDFYSVVFFFGAGVTAGVCAIFLFNEVYSRFKIISLSFIVSLPVVISIALPGVSFGNEGVLLSILIGIASAPWSVALMFMFLPVFEVMFNKVSCFKYAELTDHKSRLLARMIEEAPGTFNHAIVVSNIAEACATAIGEDALLARTCAYYHDIGKLRRPEFFRENQVEGSNPHDDLTPELSANIIKSHTVDGYSLAIKNRLPKEIADVCLQHHGTMPILYFYDKAKKFTEGEVPILQYCYAGPKPQTKIATIIMIADGAEAASRTMKDRSRDKVTATVKKIVSDRMQLGQFDECEITLKELNIIIHTVVNSLTGIYHKRIEYPRVSLNGIDIDKAKEENDKLEDIVADKKE